MAVPLLTNNVPVVYEVALVPPELNPNVPVTAVVGILIAVFVIPETRPYASVVITGIAVELPTVVTPGPTNDKFALLPVIVMLPAPLLVAIQ